MKALIITIHIISVRTLLNVTKIIILINLDSYTRMRN